MVTAIDTNILLDLTFPNSPFHAAAHRDLDTRRRASERLIICEVVYAELASVFSAPSEVDRFLQELRIRLVPSQPEALFAASQAWRIYTQRRGRQLQCLQCGRSQDVSCPSCGNRFAPRLHIVADFLIGGHAAAQADCLLTRDRGYCHNYFASLEILQP